MDNAENAACWNDECSLPPGHDGMHRPYMTSTAENDGWLPFGSLIEYDGPAECSDETGEDGLPLWERPIPPHSDR